MEDMEQTGRSNPRIDEERKHETASLTHGAGVDARSREDFRDQDPAEAPNPSDRRDVDTASGGGISQPEADARAEIARAIASARFPARSDALVKAAEAAHTPDTIVTALRGLPADRAFADVQAVWAALGGHTERTH